MIASKSPVAVQGSKVNLVYSRDHSVEEGLKFMVYYIYLLDLISNRRKNKLFQIHYISLCTVVKISVPKSHRTSLNKTHKVEK